MSPDVLLWMAYILMGAGVFMCLFIVYTVIQAVRAGEKEFRRIEKRIKAAEKSHSSLL